MGPGDPFGTPAETPSRPQAASSFDHHEDRVPSSTSSSSTWKVVGGGAAGGAFIATILIVGGFKAVLIVVLMAGLSGLASFLIHRAVSSGLHPRDGWDALLSGRRPR